MEPLQIVGDAGQRPFPRHGLQSTQQELAEAHHLFDDAKHWFHRGFAPCADRLAFRRPEPVAQPPDRVRADDPAKGLFNPPGRQVGAARVLLDPFHHLPFLVLAEAVLAPAPLPLQYPVNPALRPLILPARHRVPVEPRDRANLVNRVSPAAQQNGLRPLPDTPRPVAILQRLQVHYLLFRMRRNTR